MDWEDKFSSIVKETESNLARVRTHLGSSRVRHPSQARYYSNPSIVELPSQTFESGLCQSLGKLCSKSKVCSSNPHLKSSWLSKESCFDTMGFQSTSAQKLSGINCNKSATNGPSAALINVLFERMEQQAEALDSLNQKVKRLGKENSSQADTISTLQDQVSRLNDRLREQGVDLESERKLEGVKREMYRLHTNKDRDGSNVGDPSKATLARDLNENKKLLRDDCDSLRKEIDHLKSRIGKFELETQGTMVDAKDSNRRLDRIDRTVTILYENQRSQSYSLESIEGDREQRNSDIGSIRGKLDELARKVSDLESGSKGRRMERRSRGTLLGANKHSENNGEPQSLTNRHHSSKKTLSKDQLNSAKQSELDASLSESDSSTAFLGLSSGSESEITPIEINSHSFQAEVKSEISDLSSTSLGSLNSDEILGL